MQFQKRIANNICNFEEETQRKAILHARNYPLETQRKGIFFGINPKLKMFVTEKASALHASQRFLIVSVQGYPSCPRRFFEMITVMQGFV
jgi:hypothetical protein